MKKAKSPEPDVAADISETEAPPAPSEPVDPLVAHLDALKALVADRKRGTVEAFRSRLATVLEQGDARAKLARDFDATYRQQYETRLAKLEDPDLFNFPHLIPLAHAIRTEIRGALGLSSSVPGEIAKAHALVNRTVDPEDMPQVERRVRATVGGYDGLGSTLDRHRDRIEELRQKFERINKDAVPHVALAVEPPPLREQYDMTKAITL